MSASNIANAMGLWLHTRRCCDNISVMPSLEG
nr:MAG TPA: hypothetical protein [Caudoviricetes sp.]